MKKIIKIFVFLIPFSLLSCQSVKDGLSGRKSENSDEFLVQKKNPLVLPPDYMKLPKPNDDEESENDELARIEEETDIQKILKLNDKKIEETTNKQGSAESFVLENIK